MNDKYGIDGQLIVYTDVELFKDGKKHSEIEGILIAYEGKNAQDISFVQINKSHLEVTRGGKTSSEEAILRWNARHEHQQTDTEYVDTNTGFGEDPDYITGGTGGRNNNVVWMFDAPETGKALGALWLGGPLRGVPSYQKQKDVEAIYLWTFFHTYVVVEGCPLARVNWYAYASWNRKKQGDEFGESAWPKTVVRFVSVDKPQDFINTDEYKRDQAAAGKEFLK